MHAYSTHHIEKKKGGNEEINSTRNKQLVVAVPPAYSLWHILWDAQVSYIESSSLRLFCILTCGMNFNQNFLDIPLKCVMTEILDTL